MPTTRGRRLGLPLLRAPLARTARPIIDYFMALGPLLREALGSLVNDLIAHTPAGGSVTVAVAGKRRVPL